MDIGEILKYLSELKLDDIIAVDESDTQTGYMTPERRAEVQALVEKIMASARNEDQKNPDQ